jgi:hypothetical protein
MPQSPPLCQKGCLSVLSSVQGNRVRWVGTIVMVFFVKKPWYKEDVRQCVVVMQQPVLLSPKFGEKSLYIFTVTVKHHTSMWN